MLIPAYALVLSLRSTLQFDMPKKLQSKNSPWAFRSLKTPALKVQTFHMKISYICTTKIIFISRDHALTLVFKNRLSAAWQLFRLAQSFLQTQEYLSNIDCVMTNDKRDQDSLKSLQLISVPYILVVLELVMMKFVFFFSRWYYLICVNLNHVTSF